MKVHIEKLYFFPNNFEPKFKVKTFVLLPLLVPVITLDDVFDEDGFFVSLLFMEVGCEGLCGLELRHRLLEAHHIHRPRQRSPELDL